MGLFGFVKEIGSDLFTTDVEAGVNILKHIEANNPGVNPLDVKFDDGVVTLRGRAESIAAKEKAVLMAGNVRGVEQVIADDLQAPEADPAQQGGPGGAGSATAAATPAATREAAGSAGGNVEYYEIVSGDTLGKIAKAFYGNASAYTRIFEANREVIQDPNLIYPGQKIRIPMD